MRTDLLILFTSRSLEPRRILVFGRYSILNCWMNGQLSAATNLVITLISFLSLFKTYNSMVFLPWGQTEWYYNCWVQPSERNDEFSLGCVKFEVIAMQTTSHVVGHLGCRQGVTDEDNNFCRSSSCVQKESYLRLSKTWDISVIKKNILCTWHAMCCQVM